MKTSDRYAGALYAFSILLIGFVYLSHAPSTVQFGDSAELSASAFKLLVPHPPGYPLWIWLNHIWSQSVSIGTKYFTFALFNILTALLSLLVLGKCIDRTSIKILAVLSLGFSSIFWRYSEIPEVFVLNVLLAFGVIYLGKSERHIKGTNIPISASLMPIVFSLGIAHHHTIIFLLPFVTWACWKQRKSPWLYASIVAGIAICILLYLSMMMMHPTHLYSWGELTNAHAVWDHFIRKEYGTLNLHPLAGSVPPWPILAFFSGYLALAIGPLLGLSLFTLLTKLKRREKIIVKSWEWAVLASCVLYIAVFLPMMGVAPTTYWGELSIRFFIFPIALAILFLSCFLSNNFKFEKSITTICACAILIYTCALFVNTSRQNDFSDNTIIEDFASNLLNISSEFKNPILILDFDSFIFPTRYMQIVEDLHPNTIACGSAFFVTEITSKKLISQHPNFKRIKHTPGTIPSYYVDTELVLPNTDFTFLSIENIYHSKVLKKTFLPLGFKLTPGEGHDTQKTNFVPKFRSDTSILNTSPYDFDTFRLVFSKYSIYFLAKATIETRGNQIPQAIDSLERAVGIAPYSVIALEKLCDLKKKQNTPDKKCDDLDKVKSNFDYFKFTELVN